MMFLGVTLMILLGRLKLQSGNDGGRNRTTEFPRCLQSALYGSHDLLLFGVVKENHRAILAGDVVTSCIEEGRIVNSKEYFHQLLVAYLHGIVHHLTNLRVPSAMS